MRFTTFVDPVCIDTHLGRHHDTAARLGLFELTWNILCPGCGGVLDATQTLKSVHKEAYDCALCRLIPDEELKATLARSHPYKEWLSRTQIVLEELPATATQAPISNLALLDRQQTFGYTQEDLKLLMSPMATTGEEACDRRSRDRDARASGIHRSCRQALMNAKSIAYTTAGQSGGHFAKVIEKLGIADQVKAKGKTVPGGSTGELIVKGEAEMAVQLISELLAVPGIDIVGPFPADIQDYVVLTAGVSANAKDKTAAQALIKFLTAPSAVPVIKAKGMEPG